jgi:ABC-type Fe3+/spermidine/putrescine transport system ATPase subunit
LTAPAALQLDGVRKAFGSVPVVNGISLEVKEGEFVTLLGPSGCGKTTTLNLIAGFLAPDSGTISIGGRVVNDTPVFRRDIGLVFQDYALFPHRTVAENVAFGLRMRGVKPPEITARVADALALVQLPHLGDRRPGQLSGGQRQRVALARALVIRPAVLLLDEPLSNLDLKLREDMRLEISALQRRLGTTTILVTHDQGEALVMSDRVAVMNKGSIIQVDDPATIYGRPADRLVADFIGAMNFLQVEAPQTIAAGAAGTVRRGDMAVQALAPKGLQAGEKGLLAFRPERAALHSAGSVEPGHLLLRARLDRFAYLGGRTELHLLLPEGERCIVELANDGREVLPPPGAELAFSVSAADCLAFPA